MMANHDDKEEVDACTLHCKGVQVPTDKEVAVLNAIRSLKEEAKVVKKKMEAIKSSEKHTGGESLASLQGKMALFRKEWEALDKKREEAARERMIVLGHVER